jgi:hypothetical protein
MREGTWTDPEAIWTLPSGYTLQEPRNSGRSRVRARHRKPRNRFEVNMLLSSIKIPMEGGRVLSGYMISTPVPIQ